METFKNKLNMPAPTQQKPSLQTGVPNTMQAPMQPMVKAIEKEQLQKFTERLEKYKAGKAITEQRIIASENWWKLRNTEERKTTEVGRDGGFTSKSGWLHNVIVSKHADAVEAYPEPNILPREEGDKPEAKILSHIIPCIIEQNNFEKTYSDVMWQKLKTGTGVYKVVWDKSKLNGLGDIAIERVNLLNIYWEPGVMDIQKSAYFYHTELVDKELLREMYPELEDKLKGQSFVSTKFLYDDTIDTSNKATVIEVYYHKRSAEGKLILHYCKYVEDTVLFATENEPDYADRGLYDHGKYPYVFDVLFPFEGSPCGYGFVDLCKNPQTEIDLMKTAFIKNAMVGAVPRYFIRQDGSVNEEEFLDLSRPLVTTSGNLGEDSIRQIDAPQLNGNLLNLLDTTINELRETSGNTETSTGNVPSGITAASAIAALQEASGKNSRDSNLSAYRSFQEIVSIVIELIRQFYDMPRQFRILGQYGQEEFISYSNQYLQPQHQGMDNGVDMGFRLPVFDIKVSAQKRTVYTKVTQNELALQFFQLGFFNPQMTDQALMCLEMMDFDEKDSVMQKVSQNGTMFQKLTQYMQLALSMAQESHPELVNGLAQDSMQMLGMQPAQNAAPGKSNLDMSDHMSGVKANESTMMHNARETANTASQPDGGRVTMNSGERKQK